MLLSFQVPDGLSDTGILVARLLMAAIFIWSGYEKLRSRQQTIGYFAALRLPLPGMAWLVTVIVEVGGGIALSIGLATQWAALVLCAWSVVTAIVGHSNLADPNTRIHFMKNVAMAGGLLLLGIVGGGDYVL